MLNQLILILMTVVMIKASRLSLFVEAERVCPKDILTFWEFSWIFFEVIRKKVIKVRVSRNKVVIT